MPRKKSQASSRKTKRAAKRSTRSSTSSRKTRELEIDDIELLNAHRYPESLSSAELARIRNSRSAQERLKVLLKGMPSSKNTKDRDISVLLEQEMQKPASEDSGEDEEYEYEYEYVEEESEDSARSSKLGGLFRKFR